MTGATESPRTRENADPTEARNPLPTLFLVLLGGLGAFGLQYLVTRSGADMAFGGDGRSAVAATPEKVTGESLFASRCASCHQSTGLGVPGSFPPLAGSPWVTSDAATPVRVVVLGLTGPIDVAGTTYRSVMPAVGGGMSDDEIALVVTYVRTTWGNSASPVSKEDVATVRAALGGKTDPWDGGAALERARSAK